MNRPSALAQLCDRGLTVTVKRNGAHYTAQIVKEDGLPLLTNFAPSSSPEHACSAILKSLQSDDRQRLKYAAKKVGLILACCLLLSAPAQAETTTTTEQDGKIIIELTDSRRNRALPHHWWRHPFGRKEYCYVTLDGKRIWLPEHIKTVPDKRSWDKRRPLVSTATNGFNLIGGAGNVVRIFTH